MTEQDRQALAAEVIELGEELFALALEVQTREEGEGDGTMEEVAVACGDFFVALRLLLGVD